MIQRGISNGTYYPENNCDDVAPVACENTELFPVLLLKAVSDSVMIAGVNLRIWRKLRWLKGEIIYSVARLDVVENVRVASCDTYCYSGKFDYQDRCRPFDRDLLRSFNFNFQFLTFGKNSFKMLHVKIERAKGSHN